MTQTSLGSTENPSSSSINFNGVQDNTLAFYTNQIAYYLDNVISKFHQEKDSSVDCLKIEENLQLLLEDFHKQETKEYKSHYDAIVNVAFGTKTILSELFFGSLLENQDKLKSQLLMVENNSQKLKELAVFLQT